MAGRTPTKALYDDPVLTTSGLFAEAYAALARRLERQLEHECGLSVQWFEVLLRLARSPGNRLRMSVLAAQTTLSTSGLTRAVDRLEANGLVRREICPSDRRGYFAVLTDEGAARIDAATRIHVAELHELLDPILDADQRVQLTDLLRLLRDGLDPDAARASEQASEPVS